MNRATQEQWHHFTQNVVWHDLRSFLVECIEINRDILEGVLEQHPEYREVDDALRGRNRMARELLRNIEGWASGDIPISE